MNNAPIKQKKVLVYIPEDDYHRLRVKLMEQKKTVSGWVREKIKKFLNRYD